MSNTGSWLRRRSRVALVAGVVGTAALAMTTVAALGGFTASITNNADTVSTGTLVMQEQVGGTGGTTCLSTGTGTTGSTAVNANNANTSCPANKYGNLALAKPGDTATTSVAIKNVGSITASSLTLLAAACTQPAGGGTYVGTDTNFCSKVDITIEDQTVPGSPRCVYGPTSGTAACGTPTNAFTLASFGATSAGNYGTASTILPTGGTVVAGATRTYAFTVLIDPTAATNIDQGLTATQNITFTFAQ